MTTGPLNPDRDTFGRRSRPATHSEAMIGVLHTAPAHCPEVDRLAREQGLAARLVHVVDEGLLRTAIAEGTTAALTRRVGLHCQLAVNYGAQALLVTCSSLGLAVEHLRAESPIPLLRIDEPMARQAVRTGRRVGVLATLGSTLEPTEELLRRTAAQERREVTVVPRLCPGAFEAWRAGDTASHDQAVLDALGDLAVQVDVVVLAQASMRRSLAGWAATAGSPPVLSSPESGVAQLATLTLASPGEDRTG
ncbi:MAG TPA: aspartate/glutamate racemase family protein [Acidimicrobiales bacterium]|nr:aspartate/glutamate racemase family protein [Acidimicrobiales bacterium]